MHVVASAFREAISCFPGDFTANRDLEIASSGRTPSSQRHRKKDFCFSNINNTSPSRNIPPNTIKNRMRKTVSACIWGTTKRTVGAATLPARRWSPDQAERVTAGLLWHFTCEDLRSLFGGVGSYRVLREDPRRTWVVVRNLILEQTVHTQMI